MSTDQQRKTSSSTEIENLGSALGVTEAVIAGVRPEQAADPTPCPEYDVGRLVDHLVGFGAHFADRATGVTPAADPGEVVARGDPDGPQAAYHAAAQRMVQGFRSGAGGEQAPSIGVVRMETIAHGWDLAAATGQAAPYPDDAVESALAAGRAMLKPQYRGAGQAFGAELVMPDEAPALDRLVAFLGRDPDWRH
jgi:uncharacterized protein (TIGR03086 family)